MKISAFLILVFLSAASMAGDIKVGDWTVERALRAPSHSATFEKGCYNCLLWFSVVFSVPQQCQPMISIMTHSEKEPEKNIHLRILSKSGTEIQAGPAKSTKNFEGSGYLIGNYPLYSATPKFIQRFQKDDVMYVNDGTSMTRVTLRGSKAAYEMARDNCISEMNNDRMR